MSWWAWTLLWVVLVAGAGLLIYVAVRRLLRQGLALARELGAAADLLAEVGRTLEDAPARAAPADPVRSPVAPRGRRRSTRAPIQRHRRPERSQDVR